MAGGPAVGQVFCGFAKAKACEPIQRLKEEELFQDDCQEMPCGVSTNQVAELVGDCRPLSFGSEVRQKPVRHADLMGSKRDGGADGASRGESNWTPESRISSQLGDHSQELGVCDFPSILQKTI